MTYTMEIPDDARLEDGYIEFSGEPYLILQKRDDDGNIIAEKEIHETLENSEITSGCHGKENEEKEKKPIKSSLDERLVDFEDRIINLINDLTRLRQELDDAAYGDAGVTDAIIALRHQLKAVRMPGAVKSSRKAIKSGISSISFEKNLNDYSNDPTVTVIYDYDDGRDSDFYQKSIHECINDANNFISKGYRCLIDGLSVDNADAFDSSNSYSMVIKSSRKPIKSSQSWKADCMIQELYDQHYITEEGYNAALQKQYTDDEINTLERYYYDYRNPYVDWNDIRNIIKGTMRIIQSSHRPIKSGVDKETLIEKIKEVEPDDYSDWSVEELQELAINLGISIESSRKPIKSSLDERLVPYLEEFEEGYSDALTKDPMDSYAGFDTTDARCKTFYETFKSDHNLTDDDINNLENAVFDMWHETDAEID